ENGLLPRSALRRVQGQRAIVSRHVLGAERRPAAGEVSQIGLRVESNDEVAACRKRLGNVHSKMNPATVAARDQNGIAAALAIDVQQLLLSPDFQVLGRLGTRRSNTRAEDHRN